MNDSKLDKTHAIIDYWRNSLADADRISLSAKDMDQAEIFPLNELLSGHLSREKIQHFFEEAEKRARDKPKYSSKKFPFTDDDFEIKQLQVIIAPYVAVKNYRHGQQIVGEYRTDKIFPLWMMANLNREGILTVDEGSVYPWIDKRCLAPPEECGRGLGYPILGDVSDADAFYAKHAVSLDTTLEWRTFFSYANNLLFSLCDGSVFSKQDYTLTEKSFVLPKNSIAEPSQNIIATYDQYLLTRKTIPALLKKFSSFSDEPYCDDLSPKERFMASCEHLGQMQMGYPLSASQRESISYFSDPERNEIVTIHGPPGTGKTTLLQSIIASNWVECALEKKNPPIQVATSTNNLAVTNILDRLNEAGKETIRWLPNFHTYGLYLAPSHQIEQAKKNNYEFRLRRKNSGSIAEFYNADYRDYATRYFLEKFNNHYLKSESSLRNCQEFIHHELLLKNTLLRNCIRCVNDFHSLEKLLSHRYDRLEAIEELFIENNRAILEIEEELKSLKQLAVSWFSFKIKDLKWLCLFSWIPFIKQLLMDRIRLFTLQHDLFQSRNFNIDDVEKVIEDRMSSHASLLKQLEKDKEVLQSDKELFAKLYGEKVKLEEQLGFNLNTDNASDFTDNSNVLCQMDQTLRYDLFVLATHYWEAQWLQESGKLDQLDYHRDDREKYWRIQAMLTPCFVTTLHSGPGFFQYKTNFQLFETLEDVIDLLIIDEAGQVMPAIAGGMISIAKRLLLVGDAKQIEPIFSISEKMDFSNTKKYGLCTNVDEYHSLKTSGILCSGDAATGHAYGNLITVGQRKSKYHLKEDPVPGLFLKEHRRCAKEIISYCNELCYNNQLIPMTNQQFSHYPPMGYLHVKGREKKIGTSRSNPEEALKIVQWIQENQVKILLMCREDSKKNEKINLSDCIGIVTPFAAQGNEIRSTLYAHGLKIDKVGTIHSLQGAERPIIIFSSVYTTFEGQGTFFFDRSVNMLNVAVSRAKRSFLVFGDMDIFDASKPSQPSGLLARYLFARNENKIYTSQCKME